MLLLLLKIQFKNVSIGEDVSLEKLVASTEGFSGAEVGVANRQYRTGQ